MVILVMYGWEPGTLTLGMYIRQISESVNVKTRFFLCHIECSKVPHVEIGVLEI